MGGSKQDYSYLTLGSTGTGCKFNLFSQTIATLLKQYAGSEEARHVQTKGCVISKGSVLELIPGLCL